MNKIVLLLLVAVCAVECNHLVLGTTANRVLVHHEKAQYTWLPFQKRVKMFFYSNPDQRPIQGIMVYDNLLSKATANVTAGGINHAFVNIRMKSERGYGLDYDIGIYI